jgi:hypothetical protein
VPVLGASAKGIKAAESKPAPPIKSLFTPVKMAATLPKAPVIKEAEALTKIKPAKPAPLPKPPKAGGGGGILGTIEAAPKLAAATIADVPKELKGTGAVENLLKEGGRTLSAVEERGYQNLLGKAGKGIGEVAGNTGRDLLELPAQVLPTLYFGGKAALAAGGGHPQELEKLAKGFLHQSALGSLITGHPGRALTAAKNNPLYTALEVSGAGEAADRLGGAVAKPSLADEGAETVSRKPQELIGNAKAPRDPYSKGVVKNLVQKGQDPSVRPGETALEQMRGKNLSSQLTHHFDRQAGVLETTRRVNRTDVIDKRMDAIKGTKITGTGKYVPIPGSRAVNPFARGLLADPKVIDPETGQPLYRTQLANLVEHHAKEVPGETGTARDVRMQNVAHYQGLLDEKRLQEHPEKAYEAAGKYAQGMKKLEPELIEHRIVSNPQSLRVAKLADPFQFHWRDQDPQVEENPPLTGRGISYTQALKAREDAYTARRGSKIELDRARSAQAPGMAEYQAAARAHGEAESELAAAARARARGEAGAQARVDAARARADDTGDAMSTAGKPVKDALAEVQARHQANVAAHKAAVADLNKFGDPEPGDLQESPFSVAGKDGGRQYLPISRVEKELQEKHGVDPNKIGFVSNRPYVSPESAYYKDITDPSKAGFNPQQFRTGTAFTHGQYDPTPDALTRQHVSNQALVDQGRGSRMQVKTYALTREHVAKLLDEHPDDPHAKLVAEELRSNPNTFFDKEGRTSAWDSATRAIREVERLKPDLKLTPGRIAHQYAPKGVLSDLAHLSSPRDALEPQLWDEDRGLDQFPKDASQQQLDTGPVAVYHQAIAKALSAYQRDTGNVNSAILRSPASWWRRANIAFSPRHPFGVAQELGIRAMVNKIGPMSLLRGYRRLNLIERMLEDPEFVKNHPDAEFDAQRLKSQIRGTVAHQTEMLQRHINENQLATSKLGALSNAFKAVEQHKLAGAPLRVVKGVVGGYSHLASKILTVERKVLEHPAQVAGLGKVANDEAHAMMRKSLPVFGAVTDVERKLATGSLDPTAIDHAARQMIEYWGDWNSASPGMKKALAVAPFFNWYRNSLRFLYVTMPMHHPMATALLTTLEQATEQQRKAIGQGLNSKQKLEWEEQGSIPVGGGYIANQQYYTPQGAVVNPVGTPLNLIFPEFNEAYKVLSGSNSYGETLENSNKEQIVNPADRLKLAGIALLESFNPPLRMATTVARAGKSAAEGSTLWDLQTHGPSNEDPVGRSLGVPAGLWNALRPFKTSKERNEKGETIERGTTTKERGLPQIKLPEVPTPTVKIPEVNLSG